MLSLNVCALSTIKANISMSQAPTFANHHHREHHSSSKQGLPRQGENSARNTQKRSLLVVKNQRMRGWLSRPFGALQRNTYGKDPNHLKVIVGITIIVAETDEAAQAKRDELLAYGDREGALAVFRGWTSIDLSTYDDDEAFRFVKLPAVQSIVERWSENVPGTNLKWTKSRIAEYIILGGLGAQVVGSPKTVADELERWVEVADVDGFNLRHLTNPDSFVDIIEYVLPELQKRGIFRTKIEQEGVTAREAFLG